MDKETSENAKTPARRRDCENMTGTPERNAGSVNPSRLTRPQKTWLTPFNQGDFQQRVGAQGRAGAGAIGGGGIGAGAAGAGWVWGAGCGWGAGVGTGAGAATFWRTQVGFAARTQAVATVEQPGFSPPTQTWQESVHSRQSGCALPQASIEA